MDKQTERPIYGWKRDTQIDRQTNRQMDRQTGEQIYGKTDRWII